MQVIQVNMTSLDPKPLKAGTSIQFTYSVEWVPTDIAFNKRFERYLDYNFFEHQVIMWRSDVIGLTSCMHEIYIAPEGTGG